MLRRRIRCCRACETTSPVCWLYAIARSSSSAESEGHMVVISTSYPDQLFRITVEVSIGCYVSVAVITGGAGGMDLAMAKVVGRDDTVVLADVRGDRLDQAAAALDEVGIELHGDQLRFTPTGRRSTCCSKPQRALGALRHRSSTPQGQPQHRLRRIRHADQRDRDVNVNEGSSHARTRVLRSSTSRRWLRTCCPKP